MSDDKFVPHPPVWEDDQCLSLRDLEMMSRYNKACERLVAMGGRQQVADQLHASHVFVDALIVHLKAGKQPSFYDAWDTLMEQLPKEYRDILLREGD